MAADLELPLLPTRLYRYRSLTRSGTAAAEEISSIRDGYLYCADFSVMNDPMEGLFTSSSLLRAHPNYRTTVDDIKARKLGFGIACFSETYENMLMWAHYAGNFAGVCFGYSSKELVKGLPDNTKLVRVAYLDRPPRISTRDLSNLRSVARRTLSQKQFDWAYEREWRVLARQTGRAPYAPIRPLRSIYLGPRISDPQRDLLLTAVSGLDVSIYQMSLYGYEPVWDEVAI
jgi:hypothetical protein